MSFEPPQYSPPQPGAEYPSYASYAPSAQLGGSLPGAPKSGAPVGWIVAAIGVMVLAFGGWLVAFSAGIAMSVAQAQALSTSFSGLEEEYDLDSDASGLDGLESAFPSTCRGTSRSTAARTSPRSRAS
ncbi:hypothetical protein ET445_06150 [Agromyces protaetiae]|uniref:Uncharacterized protein n=1 Tax=Agromyces protaetiae TaxID=2509455 RepID=A0A4P6FBI4_9MICO|nr:hypothetical protein [Agromyces protaetiae]QAY72986.1 hypothetical protein ET445_06150 [Agromyces protaetiae]